MTLAQGTESWGVLDFAPGNWVVTTLYGATLGINFEVTGELPADLPVVESNVEIDLLEMVIHVADGAFVAGDNVVLVKNAGAQIHFVDVSKVPEGTTKDQVQAVMDSMMSGTPPAEGGLKDTDLVPVSYIPELSPTVQEFVPLTLESGTYMLACWAPDPETGMPHAMMGMWELITVE